MTSHNLLRDVCVVAYGTTKFRLRIWDTYQTDRMGKSRLAYLFQDQEGNVIFKGADFHPGMCTSIDSDEAVRGLLGFLTLQPGDTDSEFFESYTSEQLDFAECYGEALSMYALDEDPFPLIDWRHRDFPLGTVSHGTMRAQDLIPAFLDALRILNPEGYQQTVAPACGFSAFPSYAQEDSESEWYGSEDCHYFLESLFEALDECAPEGFYFGANPGDGCDYGFWACEPE